MVKEKEKITEPLVFGLDIGTRSIVGTVGYEKNKKFHVIAMQSREHNDRVMLDGQIHKIEGVAEEIKEVTQVLEEKLGRPLDDVCIAAAGRVLRTVNVHVDKVFTEERDVTSEDIYSLELQGVQKAYAEFEKDKNSRLHFYCVGYSVEHYFLNEYQMSSLENHKAQEIGADIIATFLPDEVVDGLYKAVGMAGLRVANLTLEPIAAMELAIPPSYRMLNIALVDVGAGTSDICITQDEAIIAYGMIPSAGDEITEVIAKECLVEFSVAEHIKRESSGEEPINFRDIMGLEQIITPDEVKQLIDPCVRAMTKDISDKIKSLNGDKPVSAVFVVGGGGKAPGFTQCLAEHLGINPQRVAVRGEEVLKTVDFKINGVKKDSLLVTPIGICLNFYNMKNNFIFLSFNGEQIKLYDNSNLRISDAAMQAGFANEDLFPKRGNEIKFTINGRTEVHRGDPGEPAVVKLNGKEVSLTEKVKAGDDIQITPSTAGTPVVVTLDKLAEFKESISVDINEKRVTLPKFAMVNGELKPGFYEIQDGDEIEMRRYYTVEQILDFMDVDLEDDTEIYVNNQIASPLTEVYDNFTVEWTFRENLISNIDSSEDEEETEEETSESEDKERVEALIRSTNISEAVENDSANSMSKDEQEASVQRMLEAVRKAESALASSESVKRAASIPAPEKKEAESSTEKDGKAAQEAERKERAEASIEKLKEKIAGKLEEKPVVTGDIEVIVNNQPVRMTGKDSYIYVDVFNYIDFDRSKPHGTSVATKINGRDAEFVEQLHNGDRLEIYWRND